jgi:hypothetical protein
MSDGSIRRALRFSMDQRRGLRVLGLTESQVSWLERDLALIADWISPQPASRDVRDELQGLASELALAAERIRRWRVAPLLSRGAYREALGHFNVAAHIDLCGIQLALDGDPASAVEAVANWAQRAADQAPTSQRRNPRASSKAIAIIVRAIERPTDTESRTSAANLQAAREGSFPAIAEIVWAAVLPGKSKATPERSIKLYLKAGGRTRGSMKT